MLLLLLFLLDPPFQFVNTTIYDPQLQSLREGATFSVDANGIVGPITYEIPPSGAGAVLISDAVVLPHFSDFYSLIQERGLGHDQDLSPSVQGRMARYFREIGLGAFRDPVFPGEAVGGAFPVHIKVLAQQGYLDLSGGPAADFSLVVDPQLPLEDLARKLPVQGPITLWWTSAGSKTQLRWSQHEAWLHQLIAFLHGQQRKVGAYIQDATHAETSQLFNFAFDFYEGMPVAHISVKAFPESIIWVPLAGLNDKRYCASKLAARINRLSRQNLYDKKTLTLAQDRLDYVPGHIAERCRVWKRRRKDTLKMVDSWLEMGGRVALGSAGGHLFSFSGDILSELEALDGLGATQSQLLAAAFQHTPSLLGYDPGYLKVDKPANFIVFRQSRHWAKLVGRTVDLNFINGKLVSD